MNASPIFLPMIQYNLTVMYLHSGAICNIPLSHLFYVFNCITPVSPESIPPPCGRQLIPVPLATKAQDFITHTGQRRYLCPPPTPTLQPPRPLSLGDPTRYWQGRLLSPREELWNPLRLNLAPCFILAFSLAALETNCYWLSLYCCRFFFLFVSLSPSRSLFFSLLFSKWHNGRGGSLYGGN